MLKKIIFSFSLFLLAFIYILTPPPIVYASHIPECSAADIKGLTPVKTGVVDTDFCPPTTTCYTQQPLPNPLYKDCYVVVVGAPPQQPSPGGSGTQPPPRSGNAVNFNELNKAVGLNQNLTLAGIINDVIPYLFGIAGFLLLLYLIFGGFSYMMSGGDPKAAESAKQKITNALIGFAIIFTAYWLVQILGKIFGITQFQQIFR